MKEVEVTKGLLYKLFFPVEVASDIKRFGPRCLFALDYLLIINPRLIATVREVIHIVRRVARVVRAIALLNQTVHVAVVDPGVRIDSPFEARVHGDASYPMVLSVALRHDRSESFDASCLVDLGGRAVVLHALVLAPVFDFAKDWGFPVP